VDNPLLIPCFYNLTVNAGVASLQAPGAAGAAGVTAAGSALQPSTR
jgi:hypothetical protein